MRKLENALNQWQYPWVLAMALAVVCGAGVARTAQADEAGYAFSSAGNVVQSGTGECVHTSSWQRGDAIPGCDGYTEPVAEAPKEVAVVEEVAAIEPVRYTLDAETFFDFDKAILREDGKQKLDTIASRIKSEGTVSNVELVGYTDPIGSDQYNQRLSQERAQAVGQYLSQQTGIDSNRFQVRGEGENNLVATCEGKRGNALIECLQPNRRVEIAINVEKSAR